MWTGWTPRDSAAYSESEPAKPSKATTEGAFAGFAGAGCKVRPEIHTAAYRELAFSELSDRVRAAWPWLAKHRPDLYQAVRDAHEATTEVAIRSAMEAALAAHDRAHGADAVRIYARLLDTELWIAPDEQTATDLERELRAEGDYRIVLTPGEAEIIAGMAETDARELSGCFRARVFGASGRAARTPMRDGLLRVTGLWERTSATGETYLVGRLGGVRVLIFQNRDHKDGDQESTHLLYVADAVDRRPKRDRDA
jgi:hypothetical protein